MDFEDNETEIVNNIQKHVFHDYREITENYSQLKVNYKNKLRKITKFEIPTIIGFRAQQIAQGASVLVDIPKHMTNTFEIAEYEFKKGKTPFIIKKRTGNECEYWKLEDLSNPIAFN